MMVLPGISRFPVIDRDEARYAEASQQMVETSDYINIRFQDKARNKKPAGIYWLQAGAIKALSSTDKRDIWVQRLPSVLGALLAVLSTYLAGLRLIGRRGAFIAASLLAVAGLFVFEAHQAKTDAMLCGLAALTLASFAHLRTGGRKNWGVVFWVAMGLGVMVKGPILPALAVLCIIGLLIWERKADWLRPLLFIPGPLLFCAIVLPWVWLIWQATDGQFFIEALKDDFGSKLASVQETHGGPPGYYIGLVWIILWPLSLFLLPGIAFALRAVRRNRGSDAPVITGARLLLMWIIPLWLILELTPTKLPHYILPLAPALAIISGAATLTLFSVNEFAWSRRLSALIFLLTSIAIGITALLGETLYGPEPSWSYGLVGVMLIASIIAMFAMWTARGKLALYSALTAAIIMSAGLYHFIIPSLNKLILAPRIATVFTENNIALPRQGGPLTLAPQFTEPSLIFHLGREVRLGDQIDTSQIRQVPNGTIVILDMQSDKSAEIAEHLTRRAQDGEKCFDKIGHVSGTNYANGDDVAIDVLRAIHCVIPPTETTTTDEASAL